jgi:hypothetical protein
VAALFATLPAAAQQVPNPMTNTASNAVLPTARTNLGLGTTGLLELGSLGLNVAAPASGYVNVSGGYEVGGAALAAANLSNGVTGSGAVVLGTSPTIASPTLTGTTTLPGSGTIASTGNLSVGSIASTFAGLNISSEGSDNSTHAYLAIKSDNTNASYFRIGQYGTATTSLMVLGNNVNRNGGTFTADDSTSGISYFYMQNDGSFGFANGAAGTNTPLNRVGIPNNGGISLYGTTSGSTLLIPAATASGTITVPSQTGTMAVSGGLAHSSKSVAAPSGTTSTTGVMMGLAGAVTPKLAGTVRISACGDVTNSASGDGASTTLYYGTGTAPANGAALTGTAVGSAHKFVSAAATEKVPFCNSWTVSGLAVGTAYWIDLDVAAITPAAPRPSPMSMSRPTRSPEMTAREKILIHLLAPLALLALVLTVAEARAACPQQSVTLTITTAAGNASHVACISNADVANLQAAAAAALQAAGTASPTGQQEWDFVSGIALHAGNDFVTKYLDQQATTGVAFSGAQ